MEDASSIASSSNLPPSVSPKPPSIGSPISSSARSSLSLDRPSHPTNQRRNRAALRNYYGLRQAGGSVNATTTLQEHEEIEEDKLSELDKEGFDPEQYVKTLLSNESLENVLKVESGLINDIRGFDGERKALVYDNYSKLIAATDTIGKMRTNMDPLVPIMATLSPAVSYIADTSSTLSKTLKKSVAQNQHSAAGKDTSTSDEALTQRQTVLWVLDTPSRLESLLAEGRQADARADWAEIDTLLNKWEGVKGVDEIRARSKQILDLV